MTTKEKLRYVIHLNEERQTLKGSLAVLRRLFKDKLPMGKDRLIIKKIQTRFDYVEEEIKRILPPDPFVSNL